jgi:hypothetical protein
MHRDVTRKNPSADASPGVRAWLLAAVGLLLLLTACSPGNQGVPSQPGEYEIRKGSVSFDGERYEFLWTDPQGGLHRAGGHDFRMVKDERNLLEVGSDSPVIHLREDEPINVQGQDEQGGFSSFWFPFLVSSMLSRPGPVILSQPAPGTSYNPAPTTPGYRYPPTDTFGRGDTLHGTVTSPRPETPDYARVQPAPGAVSGRAGGAGGGTAATAKGGFKSGASSYASKGGAIRGGKPPALNPGKPNIGPVKPSIPRGGIRGRR